MLCSFEDPGPHGSGRYSENMLPEVEKKDFRKGAQVNFHFECIVLRLVISLKSSFLAIYVLIKN